MDAHIECSPTTRQAWWKIVATFSQAERGHKFRRKSRRYACSGELKVTGVVDDEPFRQTWKLMQVSAEGLTTRAPRDIPERARVTVRWLRDDDDLMLSGIVMHCTQTIGGYKVGIKLQFPND